MEVYEPEVFATRLKALRIEKGKSQERLARELGISRSCLANYETGKRQPDNEMLVRIANIFHVLVDYLVDRTPYRNITLSPQEVEHYVDLNTKLSQRSPILDLTPLTVEQKISLLQYYDFLLGHQHRETYMQKD